MAIDINLNNVANSTKSYTDSGVYLGGVITINTDATKIDISAGSAVIVDYWTTPGTITRYDFSWDELIGIPVTYLLTSGQSYIGIDRNGTIFQYPSIPSNEDRRDVLMLSQIGHADNTTVKSVNDYTSFYDSTDETFRDLINELRLLNKGNVITPNGNNLNINKSAGSLFGMGINRSGNIKDPNSIVTPAQVPASFRYRTQTGGLTGPVTLIDPTKYDNNGTITNVPAVTTNATNQRVYLFPNNNIILQYGQQVYDSLALAIQGVQSESFIQYDNVAQGAILVGIISVRRNAGQLQNTAQAKFIPVSKFGENIGGSAGASTSSLQQAYNNSISPEILTDSILGALTVKRGSALDTDNIIEGQNGAGDITSKITGEGEIKAVKSFKTFELIDALTYDYYASNSFSVSAVANVLNVPTTTLTLNGIAYVLNDPIVSGDKLTVTVDIAAVVKLSINNVI